MDTKTDLENEDLSRYLWSLDNALNGLINLCNDKPELSDRIIGEVDNKLNVWNKHIIKVQQEKKETTTIQSLMKDDEKQREEPSKPLVIAWGDISDEDSSDNNKYLFPKPVGLCKPQTQQPKQEEETKQEEEEKEEEKHALKSDINEKENKISDEFLDINIEIENVLTAPLFIDDTSHKNDNKSPLFIDDTNKNKKNKPKKDNNNNNNKKKNENNSNKSSKNKHKNSNKNKSSNSSNNNNEGWSKVYRSKKNKILARNKHRSNVINKPPKQRLYEAEERKKLKLLAQHSKHEQIFKTINKKIYEKQKKERIEGEAKKKATIERLKRASKKKKATDLLKKEKVIKDDVRREEILLFKEWQQHEKKSAIMEKQVAAEIRKLQIAHERTSKAIKKDNKIKHIQIEQQNQTLKQKEAQNKKLLMAAKRKEKVKIKHQSIHSNVSNKNRGKKLVNNNVKKKERMNTINNENNMYYNERVINKGVIEYLSVPKLISASSGSSDQLHAFYGKTNKLLAKNNNNKNWKVLSDAIGKLLKGCGGINYEDIHYNNDVLLGINRLIQFDVNSMNYKCCKLFVNGLMLYGVNNIGSELLLCKYLKELFLFFKCCMDEYIFKKNENYKVILMHMCVVISRVFNIFGSNEMFYGNEEFKFECICYGLFELYNANVLIKISNVFREIDVTKEYVKDKIFDGFVNVLISIAGVLKEIEDSENNKIFKLVEKQLDKTKCGGILNFMSKLVFYGNSKLTTATIVLLNGCISYLNCICKINIEMLELHILEYEMEIYHIFKILLQFTSKNVMVYDENKHRNEKNNKNDKNDNIRELCKGLLEFITFSAINNIKIQDMFRFISCNKPTLLKQLCQFPFFFFINNDGKLSLYPTLIAITFNNKQNLNVLKETLNTKHIKLWLKKNIFKYMKAQKNNDADSSNSQLDLYTKIFLQKIPIKIWSRCLELY